MLLDMSGEILDVDVVLVEGWLVVEVRVNFIVLLDVLVEVWLLLTESDEVLVMVEVKIECEV